MVRVRSLHALKPSRIGVSPRGDWVHLVEWANAGRNKGRLICPVTRENRHGHLLAVPLIPHELLFAHGMGCYVWDFRLGMLVADTVYDAYVGGDTTAIPLNNMPQTARTLAKGIGPWADGYLRQVPRRPR